MPSNTDNTRTTVTNVVDFDQMRAQKMEEKRRKTERIFFKNILGVYTVINNAQMKSIEIVDMSEEGCSFQVPFDPAHPHPTGLSSGGDAITIRMYFSQDTYIPVVVKIVHSKASIDNGARFTRYGCQVDTTVSSYGAYQSFVRFMKAYSESAHKDMGDMTVFYL